MPLWQDGNDDEFTRPVAVIRNDKDVSEWSEVNFHFPFSFATRRENNAEDSNDDSREHDKYFWRMICIVISYETANVYLGWSMCCCP